MNSRLVVLGSCGPWPEAGRACSGFVLEHAGVRVVMDLGYGTLTRLLELLGSSVGDGIDAVIVTHQHPDHMLDLHGLFRARWFGRPEAAAIPLYAPEGVVDRLCGLEEEEEAVAAIRKVFDWHRLPSGPYAVGPFRLESQALPHFVPNAGVRLSANGLTVAYTGDTGPDSALVELGHEADLYIVEAMDRDQDPSTPPALRGSRMHLGAREAGEVAAAAGARRLLLTHF
jgi:ribonuclease BN (tRNA processing enzyme)